MDCAAAALYYGINPGSSFGTAPSEVQNSWKTVQLPKVQHIHIFEDILWHNPRPNLGLCWQHARFADVVEYKRLHPCVSIDDYKNFDVFSGAAPHTLVSYVSRQ